MASDEAASDEAPEVAAEPIASAEGGDKVEESEDPVVEVADEAREGGLGDDAEAEASEDVAANGDDAEDLSAEAKKDTDAKGEAAEN